MKRLAFFVVLISVVISLFLSEKFELFQGHGAKDPGYISANIGGQMGNQMFKIAATIAYAIDHDLTPIFPSLNSPELNFSYNRDRIFFRLDTSESPVPLKMYVVDQPNWVHLPNDLNNVLLEGGFFSWKFFDHHRGTIQDLFAPSESVLNRLREKYASLIEADNTVAVHVRTYSPQTHEAGLHFVGFNFFENALAKFPEDSLFVVFSDRINWSKANFEKRFPQRHFVFIEGNDGIEDLFLMSLMKNQILSRSTFSWWAAYLNKTPTKKIYTPVVENNESWTWLKSKYRRLLAYLNRRAIWFDEDYQLPEWETLDYQVEPYPQDMRDYDAKTQSVDPIDQ